MAKIIESYSDSKTKHFQTGWMQNLSDDILISEISIPGTHDTIASLNGIPDWALCQSLTLQSQMKLGIRYLDIRCRLVREQILIYHSIIYLGYSFYEILQQILNFLQQFPYEVFILRIKKEGHNLPENSSITFSAMIQSVFDKFSQDLFWFRTDIPKLKQVRGKLVILQNFASDQHLGIPYDSLDVSDLWSTDQVDVKMKSIINHLKSALTGNSKKLFLTHSSCTGHLLESQISPKDLATEINPRCFEFIKSIKGRLGIIAMDFPDFNLVSAIVNSNCNNEAISKL